MKILLIQPPSDYFAGSIGGAYPPFGLWLVGSALKREGFYAEILDLNIHRISPLEISKKAEHFDFIGVSCALDNFQETAEVVKAVREASSCAKIIGGGPAASVVPQFYLDSMPLDYVVVGEGENAILEIVNGCNDKIVKSKKPATLVCPDYSLLNVNNYWQEKAYGMAAPFASLFASRGCPFTCAFCASFYLGKHRAKAVEEIEKEIKIIKNKGAKSLIFLDATFGIRIKHTIKLCLMLEEYQLPWMCMTRVDVLNDKKIEAMARSNCKRIYLGIETFSSQRVLDISKKGTTVEKNLKVIEKLRDSGIIPCSYLLFGLPGDTNESIDADLEMIRKLEIRVTPGTLFPIPGTPTFKMAEAKGMTIERVVKEIMPAVNITKRGEGFNLSDASDQKIEEAVMEIWEHNKKLERLEREL